MSASQEKPSFIVRKAQQNDIGPIYQMIKELAEWEKMTHKLKLTAEEFAKDFSENAFRSMVVESSDGALIGYAIYALDYCSWDGKSLILNDIYIKSECRGQNIGEKLFVAVMKDGHSIGVKRAHFHVLSWNPAIKFYKRLGCTDGGEYLLYRLEQENFKKLIEKY